MPNGDQRIDFLDFELSIWAEGRKYYAKVLESPAGQSGRTPLRFPFGDPRDPELLLRLENAVLRGRGQVRGPVSKEEKVLREFGQAMFTAVFREASEIAVQYKSSLTMYHKEQREYLGLRLRLRIESPELARLPWEYLYDDSKKNYLGLLRETPIVRFLELGEPSAELQVSGPLNILGMIANPGGDWPMLDAEGERTRIEKAMEPLEQEKRVHFRWVPGQTAEDILDMMRLGRWHVFHFIGHGGMEEVRDGEVDSDHDEEGYIILCDSRGEPVKCAANELKYYLEGDRSLRLVVLNCCEGGKGTAGDAFASPGAALVRAGVPAVVAMQFPISDAAAVEFASGFYKSLASGLSLEEAVTDARKQMRAKSDVGWGIPVFYTHSKTGRLFRVIGKRPPIGPADDQPSWRPPGDTPERERAREELRRLFGAG